MECQQCSHTPSIKKMDHLIQIEEFLQYKAIDVAGYIFWIQLNFAAGLTAHPKAFEYALKIPV
ncbi:hypothetical protein OUZ56_004601 [Daphnia magna]|uniref:Uncharacterized protein n=1 Tax=Daphnia magna TaxID=35525 RepID=A0ABQ9YQG6_9CRUS|nr:hypothetical protein OUZ56_004601 [Daphnia magna]